MQSDMNDFYGTQTVYQAVGFCPGGSHINIIYTRVFSKIFERIGNTEMGL